MWGPPASLPPRWNSPQLGVPPGHPSSTFSIWGTPLQLPQSIPSGPPNHPPAQNSALCPIPPVGTLSPNPTAPTTPATPSGPTTATSSSDQSPPQPGDTRRAAQGTVVGQTLRFRFSLFKGPQMSVAHCCLGPGLFPRMHVGPQCVMCPHFPLCPLPFNPVAHTPAPLQPSSLPCTPVFLDSINHVL